jgi:uncharacterized SAM-binding protein YcdF (DUF218 family)
MTFRAALRRSNVLTVRKAVIGVSTLLVAWLLAWLLAVFLEVSAPLPRADAIVVLGGSSAYIERTALAVQLYSAGKAPRIILTNDNLQSGWSNIENRNPLFVERAGEELKRWGIQSDRVEVLPQPVKSTYEEAMLLRGYAAAHQSKALIFVTSPYHSRRSLWTIRRVFRDSGIEVGLETMPPGQQSPSALVWWASLRGWRQVALEYPKLIYYWLYYR